MNKLLKKFGLYFCILLFISFTLVPIAWCTIISVSQESEIFQTSKSLLPENPTLDNYKALLDFKGRYGEPFLNGLISSIKAVAITLTIGIPIAVLTAYPLARIDFKGKRLIMNILLLTFVIPTFTTIIPLYAIFASLGILGNAFAISMVYVSSFLPLITWIITNYMMSIPIELDEAARIDGCGRWTILFKVILPNSLPIILAVVLMMFLMTWNQYQIPMILGISDYTKPLSVVVADFSSKDSMFYGMIAACGILSLLPPALVAVIFRKSLVLGLMQGAVKG